MSGYYQPPHRQRRSNGPRLLMAIVIGIIVVAVISGIAQAVSNNKVSVLSRSGSKSASAVADAGSATVPWDYKIEEGRVVDLIGADMTISPNNQLLPNDSNYATGDKVWVLSYMTAEIKTGEDGQNAVTLSSWSPLKSFHSAEAAQQDLAGLKVELKADVDLVGVYKTEFEGKHRQFAVMTLPTGHSIKQPITEERYQDLKSKKQVKVILEEVHDFGDYDLAMSKFRGWAD